MLVVGCYGVSVYAKYSRYYPVEQPKLPMLLAVLEFAFIEEIIFRPGIHNYLTLKFGATVRAHRLAVLLTSVVWALAHAGTLDSEWVKFLQIFVLGLGLGWLNRRYGLEACIVTHGVFNLVMVSLSQYIL